MSEFKMFCRECEKELDGPLSNPPEQCPYCGSSKLKIQTFFEETIPKPREWTRTRLKDDSKPSKKKIRHEQIIGEEKRIDKDKWVDKTRITDKDGNRYRELVVDQETGEVLRDVDEKLTDHIGHGSAKFKKKKP